MDLNNTVVFDTESNSNKAKYKCLDERLLSAAESGHSLLAYKIIKSKYANINYTDEYDRTTPIMAAAKGGHIMIVRMLIEAGCDVDQCNSFGMTPLHIAARYEQVEIIKLLLNVGAKYKAKNKEGLMPKDFSPFGSQSWSVLHAASFGKIAALEDRSDMPVIPEFAIAKGTEEKKKKKSGKKGKKKGKKKK